MCEDDCFSAVCLCRVQSGPRQYSSNAAGGPHGTGPLGWPCNPWETKSQCASIHLGSFTQVFHRGDRRDRRVRRHRSFLRRGWEKAFRLRRTAVPGSRGNISSSSAASAGSAVRLKRLGLRGGTGRMLIPCEPGSLGRQKTGRAPREQGAPNRRGGWAQGRLGPGGARWGDAGGDRDQRSVGLDG